MTKRLFILLTCLALPAMAQFSSAVQGTVLDPSAASVAGAKITLRNDRTGITSDLVSNSSGFYRFSALAPGEYEIKAEAPGFRVSTTLVTLTTGQTRDLSITLAVQSTGESVSVTGEAPVLDTSESRQQLTMDQKKIRDLPLLNNSIFAILTLAPGVTGLNGASDNFNPEYFAGMSANGASPRGNTYNVDGLSITSNITNGTANLGVNPEAVEELTVETNTFKAEQGLGSSIVVSITSKAGTNQFHGAANYWFTNQDMRARTSLPFIAAYAPFKRNNVSGAFGGPIQKNKTFFFTAVEMLRQTDATASVETIESPQFLTWARGAFPNTLGTKLLTDYPASAVSVTNPAFRTAQQVIGADCGTAAAANIPCALPVLAQGTWGRAPRRNGLQYSVRGDRYFREGKDRVFGSFIRTESDNNNLDPRPFFDNNSDRFVNAFQANYTHTFKPSILNEFAVSGNRVQGFNGFDAKLRIPSISISGSRGLGVGGGLFVQNNWNWRDVLTWVKGSHSLKFGGNYFWGNDWADFPQGNSRPTFNFNNLLDLVRDQPFSGSGAARDPLTGQQKRYRFGAAVSTLGLFVQDEWKVRPNMTLTLSLRYDDFGNPYGIQEFLYTNLFVGQGSNYVDQFRGASIRRTDAQFPGSLRNNWSPRFGFAWAPGKTRKWSVRGGIGMYYDWITLGESIDRVNINPPNFLFPNVGQLLPIKPIFGVGNSDTYPYGFTLPTIPSVGLDARGGLAGVNSSVGGIDPNLKAPRTLNYLIGVEREVAGTVLGINYSGSRAVNGLVGTDHNRIAGDLIDGRLDRINPSFGSMTYILNSNSITYQSMILSARRRFGNRGTVQGSYTAGVTNDYYQGGSRSTGSGNVPDPSQLRAFRANSAFDVRHRLSVSGVYRFGTPFRENLIARHVLGGWEIGSTVIAQTGTPYWITNNAGFNPIRDAAGQVTGFRPLSGDYNADGVNFDLPNVPANFVSKPDRAQFLGANAGKPAYDVNAITAPAVGTVGNSPRNAFRQQGVLAVDGSVIKNNRLPMLGEAGNLQLKFEFFNAINRVNLGNINSNVADPNFGRILGQNGSAGPRTVQIGARIAF
ncbi:MAG: TonB-dependent receptor [Bryobacterales bacterium]|nr:TonB-dependent receptor [Bryobacterales bacterium]